MAQDLCPTSAPQGLLLAGLSRPSEVPEILPVVRHKQVSHLFPHGPTNKYSYENKLSLSGWLAIR